MESKVAFTLAMALKLLLKDGLIILLIILPLGPVPTLTEALLTKLPSQSLPTTAILGLIVLTAGLAYMGAAFFDIGICEVGSLLPGAFVYEVFQAGAILHFGGAEML